jgi:hypothetical protein
LAVPGEGGSLHFRRGLWQAFASIPKGGPALSGRVLGTVSRGLVGAQREGSRSAMIPVLDERSPTGKTNLTASLHTSSIPTLDGRLRRSTRRSGLRSIGRLSKQGRSFPMPTVSATEVDWLLPGDWCFHVTLSRDLSYKHEQYLEAPDDAQGGVETDLDPRPA